MSGNGNGNGDNGPDRANGPNVPLDPPHGSRTGRGAGPGAGGGGRADGDGPAIERPLTCDEARLLLMGYLDGELDAAQVLRLEDHLAVCVSCRREERSFRKLDEVALEGIEAAGYGVDVDAAWQTIYARLERATGWILLSIGLVALLAMGLWTLLNEFFLDPEVPLGVRLAVGSLLGGLLLLLVSIGRERWFLHKTERYREVKR